MDSWRDAILREFTPQVARLTLVADPDGLLLLKGIEERGFELIPFDDHVAFRYAYETRYRSRWDGGELTDLVVVLRAAAADLRSLPHDLLQAGRRLSFNLGDLFPSLSYPVVAALDRSHFDALYEAQSKHPPGALGDNATKDYLLRHVFGVAPELVGKPSDLLRSLLRRHYRGLRLPQVLDDRWIDVLRQNGAFASWPLDVLVRDREAFFAFLQERWPAFLDRLHFAGGVVAEPAALYDLEFGGPVDLPFDHDDVRVFVDNLFLEGVLEPVAHPRAQTLAESWAVVGVRIDLLADRQRRWDGLFETVDEAVPGSGARHQDWQAFAVQWAQLIALRQSLGNDLGTEKTGVFAELRQRVDGSFLAWVAERYGTLHNQPALPPVMIHHVPRLLARQLAEERRAKVALVIVDGLSLDQWIVVREGLRSQRPELRLREGTVFAWIPTLTMVSRQACFAGRAPLYFPASIHTTDKEPKSWKRFWEDEGLAPAEVGFEKNIRDASDLERVDHLTSHPRVRAIGIVADKVDRIMHGMELGTAGMHNQVRQWVELEVLADLLDLLLDRGFDVFLAADHGNIEASGCGRPGEGSLADLRGTRARVFKDSALRARVHARFPDAIAWPPIGLPEDYLALIAPHRAAFVQAGQKLVGHGGITVEEVIVPLIRIERT
jgi:hypothetical protein